MSLHKHTLSFDLERHQNKIEGPPILRDVIRKTNEHQIRQHTRMAPISFPLQLKIKTKKALGNTFNTIVPTRGGLREPPEAGGGGKRGATSWSKSRGDSRLSQTKRQLQLLSNFYKHAGPDQIKRYQEQLQHQESQIHRTVATYNFRRTSMHYRNSPPSRHNNQKRQKSLDLHPQKITVDKPTTLEYQQPQRPELEPTIEKYLPYRRLLLSRRKSKGIVSPWGTSQPSQLN